MYIDKILVNNFKSFTTEEIKFKFPDGTRGSGLNIFVGENNSGKTNIFEAIDFVRNGTSKSLELLKNNVTKSDFSVEVFFRGEIKKTISSIFSAEAQKSVLNKFLNVVEEVDGQEVFRLKRQSKLEQIVQGGKNVDVDAKTLLIFNPESKQYENITGLPTQINALFDAHFLYAHNDPISEVRYGSSTLSGKLLSRIVKDFQNKNKDAVRDFLDAYRKLFNDSKTGLQGEFNAIAGETEKVLEEQFKKVGLKFELDDPIIEEFFKRTNIKVKDLHEYVPFSDVGSGLQRAVALALLQVYAKNSSTGDKTRPFFMFIDEPEISYHPQAQIKLKNSFCEIAKNEQIFICTHSPFFVPPELVENVARCVNKTVSGSKVLTMKHALESKEKDVLDVEVRNIFFASDVLCVEGKTDLRHLSGWLPKEKELTIIKMGSCGEVTKYWKILTSFGYEYKILLDLDVLNNKGSTFKKIDVEIDKKINEEINISTKNKDSTPLKDENLDDVKKKIKAEVIAKLSENKIHVLPAGMIEDYFNADGTVVDALREAELKAIFA